MSGPDAADLAPFALPLRREADAVIAGANGETVLIIDPSRNLDEDAAERIADLVFARLTAAPVREEGGAVLDAQTVTLDWNKVETTALEEWRAEFGDYVCLVTLGHDNVWAYRVNNSGRLHFKDADEAKGAALTDLRERLSLRLFKARETVALYDAALATREEAPAEAGEITDRMITEALKERFTPERYARDHEYIEANYREPTRRQLVAALRAQPQAREEAQPVAWMITFDLGFTQVVQSQELVEQFRSNGRGHITPLYTTPPAAEAEKLRVAVADIAAERQRQVDVEGWSEAHDDEHDDHQMARAAGCYAFHAGREYDDEKGMLVSAAVHHGWPWDRSWWKPKSRRADLVRAGALIVAEIERLDRQALAALQQEGR